MHNSPSIQSFDFIQNEIIYEDHFPLSPIIKKVELPAGWRPANADILCHLVDDDYLFFVESSVTPARDQSEVVDNEHNNGWSELSIGYFSSISEGIHTLEDLQFKFQKQHEQPSIINSPNKKSKRSFIGSVKNISKFARNLNEAAASGSISTIVGRENELSRMETILSKSKKNNPILIGKAGVGKTALVEGLALKIFNKKSTASLKDKVIWEVSLLELFSGAGTQGSIEKRIKKLLDVAIDNSNNVIVFFDEIHLITQTRNIGGGIDLGNILKPYLARGNFRCIGATTEDEYLNIEQDKALARRFQKVVLNEPSMDEVYQILTQSVRPKLEQHHSITISDASILAGIKLSDRYIRDRSFPDKAIDVIDEAAAICKKSGKNNSVSLSQVKQVISEWTQIPLSMIDRKKQAILKKCETDLRARIIGQNLALDSILDTLKLVLNGLTDQNRPNGVFFFAGPTGVGKTETAKILAESLFNTDIIRFDMGEFQNEHSVSRLLGAPPGYIGYDQGGGELSSQIKNHPFNLILFDEIDKAHSSIFNIFLQILEEGDLTNSHGQVLDFRNTILIFTGNYPINYDNTTSIRTEMNKYLKPEIINRLDKIILFNQLQKSDISAIVDLSLIDLTLRLEKDNHIRLTISEPLRNHLTDKSYMKISGAREVRRNIDKLILVPLSDVLITKSGNAYISINLDIDNNGSVATSMGGKK